MVSVKKPFEAFMAGFTPILSPETVSCFTANELKLMAEGTATISIEGIKDRANINGVEASTI